MKLLVICYPKQGNAQNGLFMKYMHCPTAVVCGCTTATILSLSACLYIHTVLFNN